MASSSGWMPIACMADVQTSGNSLAFIVALRSPATSCSCVSVPSAKNASMSASSASATISSSCSRACVRLFGHVRRHVAFGDRAAAVGGEGQRLHADRDRRHRVNAALLANRQLNRDDLTSAVPMQGLERPFEAGAIAFEAADGDDARQVQFSGLGPELLGLHFDAGDGIDDDEGALDRRAARRAHH